MHKHLSILCTGTELLDGRIEDSNSRYLAATFETIGAHTQRILCCRDSIEDIQRSITFLLQDVDILFVSGGLGPTSDDVTREAIAAFLNLPLQKDDQALADLQELYRKRRRTFDNSNTKQVYFPQHARILKNPIGTAAGFHCEFERDGRKKHILVGPGVPHELHRMCADHFLPFLLSKFQELRAPISKVFKVFGIPESKVGELVEASGVPAGLSISYRAHYPEVIVKLSGTDDVETEQFAQKTIERLGRDFVFSTESTGTIESAVQALFIQHGLTLATAESCTGGGIGALLTDTPGSSSYFLGGVISYSNEVKISTLGVSSAALQEHGAVSAEIAMQMASGVRTKLGSSVGISVTGIAGPDGGSTAKPVGTFYIGLCDKTKTVAFHCFASASRLMIRKFSAYTALDILRRYALGVELRPDGIIGKPPGNIA